MKFSFAFFLCVVTNWNHAAAEPGASNVKTSPIAVISQTKTIHSYVHPDGEVEIFSEEELPHVKLDKDSNTNMEQLDQLINKRDQAVSLLPPGMLRRTASLASGQIKKITRVSPSKKSQDLWKAETLDLGRKDTLSSKTIQPSEDTVFKSSRFIFGTLAAAELSNQYHEHKQSVLDVLLSPAKTPAETSSELVASDPY